MRANKSTEEGFIIWIIENNWRHTGNNIWSDGSLFKTYEELKKLHYLMMIA